MGTRKSNLSIHGAHSRTCTKQESTGRDYYQKLPEKVATVSVSVSVGKS